MRTFVLSLMATAALAAPPAFVLQKGGGARPVAAPPSQQQQHDYHHQELPELSVEDFLAVENSFKHSVEQAIDQGQRLVHDAFHPDDNVDAESGFPRRPHPPQHPLPPPVFNFSEYTILEIVNSTYKKHHEDEDFVDIGRFARKLRKGLGLGGSDDKDGDHHHSPEHLPLNHLAWLINFSPEAAELLKKEDITLLAPDNHALKNSHKRKEHTDKFANLDDAPRGPPSKGFFDSASAPHPFHSRELSPKKLAKLTDSDDEDNEEKKRIFKKLIAYVGKYHVLNGKWMAHELADKSTVSTQIAESRVRVEPTLHAFPFPHPSLKFNSYANKRGPTILAKNGVIHLIDEPLLPPFGPLNQIFLAPKFFGLFTNSVQKVGMAGKGDALLSEGAPADALLSGDLSDLDFDELVGDLMDEHKDTEYTVFLPSNFAFARLPLKVAAFLHSPFPFAKKVLKYLLGYHIVPDFVLFTDYVKNGSSASADAVGRYVVKEEIDVEVPMSWLVPDDKGPDHPDKPHPPPHAPEHPPFGRANVTHYVLPTLLTEAFPNATLKVAVVSHRIFGKGPIRRELIVFPSLPPRHHHEHDKNDKRDRIAAGYRRFGGRDNGHHDGGCHDGPPKPHPVKVAYTDLPVRGGAVHVLGVDFLLPPPPEHLDEKMRSLAEAAGFGFSNKEVKKLNKLLTKLAHA